jgi:hypothetical protein
MAKKSQEQEMIEQPPASALSVPEYLRKAPDELQGVDNLNEFIVPPRIKVVQKQSNNELLSQFDPGCVISMPQRVLVADMQKNAQGRSAGVGVPFHFVPIFFFPEWCTWNPRGIDGIPMIRDRTLDRDNPLVAKARTKELRIEPYPEKPMDDQGRPIIIRHVEHLNFVVMIIGENQLAGIPMVMSFSRGEHRAGSNFASLIKLRKADIFGCVFEGMVHERTNNDGEWFGVDVTNPSADSGVAPWTPPDLYESLKPIHEEYKDAYHKQLIRVDHDDEADVEVSSTKEF